MAGIKRLGAFVIYFLGIAFAVAYVAGAFAEMGFVPPTAF